MNMIVKLIVIVAILIPVTTVQATDIEAFFGEYSGTTIHVQNGKEVQRDLSVTIARHKDNFRVNWKTTKIKASGKTSTKSYSIDFESTDRENIYSSAMKANLFGGRQPLDPMKGDPYVWAQITKDLLTVHAMIITEEGGYEMLKYDRRLVEGGLDLHYSRIKDGEQQREIHAHLDRVSN